ncbi:MAG: putative DNA binding domain-containing protein [Paludibacteraceae bacterium]|nr:putative DNA binding domain-containing protein [Paludibacteraceae bacterium]
MTVHEILTRKEDQTFDCKSIQIDPKTLAVPIVAFANADGGVIAIGISDKSRKIEGIDQYTEKINELLRVPLDFCNPSVPVICTYLPCKDKEGNENHILLMEIPASSSLHTNQADEAFMRVGDKSRKLTFNERVQLMYDKGERYYEDTAVYGATIDDIDLDTVAEYAKMVGYSKTPLQYLRENNGFVTTNKKGEEDISTACILLFGKNPQKFFPRARTRFIRYEGVDEKVGAEMNVIKDVTFESTILNQVKRTIKFIETQVREHTFLGQHAQFVTKRDYPEFVIQEMTVNACCHRAYNIKGTEIQIKMFDDRLVFESPGKLPGQVKPNNIRHTHFSRNPKIAAFLKAYHYVKEFGEGFDRICREQEANGANVPSFRTDEFILKITVPKVNEKVTEKVNEKVTEKVTEKVNEKVTEKVTEKVAEKTSKVIEKVTEKAAFLNEKLTENKILIIKLMIENPYISRYELSQHIGISENSISRNIEAMRGKYLRRVGPDKGGFWEIII